MVNKKKIISPPPLLYHHLLLSLSLSFLIILTKTWLTLISNSNTISYLAFLFTKSPQPNTILRLSAHHPIPFLDNYLSLFLLFFALFYRLRHLGFTPFFLLFLLLKEGLLFLFTRRSLELEFSSNDKVF